MEQRKGISRELGIAFGLASVLFAVFGAMYAVHHQDWMRTCAITFGTTFYHFVIRFLSPVILTGLFHGNYDWQSPWFRPRPWEAGLYRRLKVKRWKRYAPAYDPRQFSLRLHRPEEILRNMCHAEVCHELIAALSLCSMGFALFFGAFAVFAATGIASALFDLVFVVIQRFNRPRIAKLL